MPSDSKWCCDHFRFICPNVSLNVQNGEQLGGIAYAWEPRTLDGCLVTKVYQELHESYPTIIL